jgi:hypothetical protein
MQLASREKPADQLLGLAKLRGGFTNESKTQPLHLAR